MVSRESDQLIVLGGRESRSQGEAVDSLTELAQETLTGHGGLEPSMPTSLRGIAKSSASWIAEASQTEEPGARKPHAGICAGGAGQLASLPRWRSLPERQISSLNY